MTGRRQSSKDQLATLHAGPAGAGLATNLAGLEQSPDVQCSRQGCGHDLWRHGWSATTFRTGGCVVHGCKCEQAESDDASGATS